MIAGCDRGVGKPTKVGARGRTRPAEVLAVGEVSVPPQSVAEWRYIRIWSGGGKEMSRIFSWLTWPSTCHVKIEVQLLRKGGLRYVS